MSDSGSQADGSEDYLEAQSDADFEYDYQEENSEHGAVEEKDEEEIIGSTIVKPICLFKDEMVESLVAEVQSVAEGLHVSFISASQILRSKHWDRVRVFEEFTGDEGLALLEGSKQQGDILFKVSPETEGLVACYVCCDEYAAEEMLSAGCDHFFCKGCWGHYLTELVDVGQVFRLACMEPKCGSPCCDELIQMSVSDATYGKYKNFMGKLFIDEHPYIFWCPNAGCDRAVRVPNLSELSVQCHCGYQFCIKCSKEAHAPCSCSTMDAWTAKNGEEGATANWLIANTKICPNCQKPIEKNGGCNHMTCSQCRHEFCWLCMGDWKKHSACNSFKASERVDQARVTLERYLFYWQRYNTHLQSQKLEHKILNEAVAQIDHMRLEAGSREVGYYLLDAAEMLIACRRALKYTYVHAYYMQDQKEKTLFEFLQQQLEYNTEILSGLLSNDRAAQTTVVNQTASAKRRLDNLLEGAKEGLLMPNDTEEWAKWQDVMGIDENDRLIREMVPPAPKDVRLQDLLGTAKRAPTTGLRRGFDEDQSLALAIERSFTER